jgi:hypothetical protein
MSEGWYYAKDGSAVGPVTLDDLQDALRRQSNAARVLVWKEGFEEWVEAGTVAELAKAVAGPPPLPTARPVIPAPRISPLSPEYRQAREAEKPPGTRTGKVIGIAVAVISLALSKIIGGVFWMPVLLISLSIWAFKGLKLRDYAAWMLGMLVGHTLWMTIGHATLYGTDQPDSGLFAFLFDFVAVVGLTIWGIRTQSVALSVVVSIYQVLALLGNVVSLDEYTKISTSAAGMHIVLRVIGIGLAVWAIVQARRFKHENEIEPLAA